MTRTIRVAGIVLESVTDGPGIRLALFCQGCHHNCPGCHNPETHDPAGGREMTVEEITALYNSDPLLSGITFSGGEPFLQPEPDHPTRPQRTGIIPCGQTRVPPASLR